MVGAARFAYTLLVGFGLCWPFAVSASPVAQCNPALVKSIPPRSPTAAGGRAFARQVDAFDSSEREAAIERAILAGNMPLFLRQLVPVRLTHTLPSGRAVDITVCVLPDYLAVGSDRDFLFVPMRLSTALSIGGRYGFTLPTAKLVDSIYAQSPVRLVPQPLPASDEMRSTAYYWRHNALIAEQRASRGLRLGALTAGHKKDLVLTNRLWTYSDRVALYGWQHADGSAIQPLSTVHGARYADYSHGVRLVSTTAYVDGEPRSLFQILADPQLAPILSSEGPIVRPAELAIALSAPPRERLAQIRAK
jgi:hypothetical protein